MVLCNGILLYFDALKFSNIKKEKEAWRRVEKL